MEREAVIVERRGPLTILRLNEPETMNALSDRIKQRLHEQVSAFIPSPLERCLMITGTGKAFCAGGNIRTMQGDQPPLAVRKRIASSTDSWVRDLIQCEKPIVTAVNGAAVGAGFALAMLGDVILASEQAYFMAGFGTLGVAADLGLALTLPRAVGMVRAKDILLRNRRITAAEAKDMGMITEAVPLVHFEDQAISAAEELANKATVGLGLTKMLINTGYEEALNNFFKIEALAQAAAFSTADREEGVQAFLEKRPPSFQGG